MYPADRGHQCVVNEGGGSSSVNVLRAYGGDGRRRFMMPFTIEVHNPQKEEADYWDKQIHEWKDLYLCFLFFSATMCRNSAITPASPLIRKFTTLRSTMWCSYYSVVKRQQFSCPVGTAALSMRLENVVPDRWICLCSCWGQVVFTAPPSMSSTVLVRTSIFRNISS